jgi:hypothetical protein
VNDLLLLASLLVVPGLMGLLVLMDWLERTYTLRQVGDDIAQLLASNVEADGIEAAVARLAEPAFR